MEEQSEQQSSQPTRGLTWWIWAVLLLPLIYLLSSGPMLALSSMELVPSEPTIGFYFPLLWLGDRWHPFEKALRWYYHVCGGINW